MRTVVFATFGLLAAPLVAGVPAFAQGNPSTSQIIQSLKPSGNLLQGGTRGIRLVSPSTPAAPAASSAAADRPHATRTAARPGTPTPSVATGQPPATREAAPSVSLNVDFPTNSAALTPQAMNTLDTLGHALSSQDLATYRFRIEGHTDTVGSPAYNQALSQRRAEAVAGYLEQKFGIPTTRLQAVGMGEQGLLVMTPPQTAEIRNRRVEIVNIGA